MVAPWPQGLHYLVSTKKKELHLPHCTLKGMEEKGLIYRKKNPKDGRSVLICLTEFGREMRDVSKTTVLRFNDAIRANIDEEKLKNFYEVSEVILELISNKKIYNSEMEVNADK